MGIFQQASDAFVLATANDEIQDRWIPDEEWVHHIRSKEYLKPCMVNSLNSGISRKFQFYNDRYECPFAERVLSYFIHKHQVTVSKTTGEKKTIYFYFYLSTQKKAIPEISNRLWSKGKPSSVSVDPERSSKWTYCDGQNWDRKHSRILELRNQKSVNFGLNNVPNH